MADSRFNPESLEPKNGDFAKFIEDLNNQNIKELKALQVNEVKASDAFDVQAKTEEPFSRLEPHPVMPVPSPARVSMQTVKKVMPIWILFAFLIIFVGMFTGDERIIMSGFFLAFITIFVGGILSNILGKRKR